MQKKNKDLTIILSIVLVILLGYLFSEMFLKQEPVTPQYDKYQQDNRLSRIRQGLVNK